MGMMENRAARPVATARVLYSRGLSPKEIAARELRDVAMRTALIKARDLVVRLGAPFYIADLMAQLWRTRPDLAEEVAQRLAQESEG